MPQLLFDNPAARFFTSPATWTLATLGAALVAWWNADDHGTANMTDDGSGLISAWKDRVGALSLTAATTARPTWAATSFNSAYPGVTGDGVANVLNLSATTGLPTGSTEGWIFLLASCVSNANLEGLFGYGANITNQSRNFFKNSTNKGLYSVSGNQVTDTAISIVGPHILATKFTSTTIFPFVDGAATTPASAAVALNTNTTRVRMFANMATTAAQFSALTISKAVITTALTTAQQQQIEGYWAWNYGLISLLASDHPYKNAAP